MGVIERIIDISNTKEADKQIKGYFEIYPKLPRAVVACPGGLVRSKIFANYLEANKLAVCPLNAKIIDESRAFTAIGYRDLKFMIMNANNTMENSIDVVVLSGIPVRRPLEKICKIIKEIPENTPVVVLGGEEGNFFYFCQRVSID